MSEETPRLRLPYIRASQAQKEVTLNMGLNICDALLLPVVQDRDLSAPPLAPVDGGLWLVASGASGAWSGQAGRVAQFIGGAWVFHDLPVGAVLWVADEVVTARRGASGWVVAGTISDATGGTVVDVEARAALNALLAACRGYGLIRS
jgi:hypothetical protein